VATAQAVADTPVDFFFADDARQAQPTRPGMGAIVAFGGVRVAGDRLAALNRSLDSVCREKYHFPSGEEFKWSPSRSSWMAKNIKGSKAGELYGDVIAQLILHDVVVTVMTSEERGQKEFREEQARRRTVKYYLERVEQQCARRNTQAFVVVDQPGGGAQQQTEFLSRCADIVESGTFWVQFGHMAHSLLAADSRSSRVLQAADLVTSVVASVVAGRTKYAKSIFDLILPLLDRNGEQIHGYGLKIDPDHEYCNLYYWLLGVEIVWRGNSGTHLPHPKLPYATDPMQQ
jgi:hypothetical protein